MFKHFHAFSYKYQSISSFGAWITWVFILHPPALTTWGARDIGGDFERGESADRTFLKRRDFVCFFSTERTGFHWAIFEKTTTSTQMLWKKRTTHFRFFSKSIPKWFRLFLFFVALFPPRKRCRGARSPVRKSKTAIGVPEVQVDHVGGALGISVDSHVIPLKWLLVTSNKGIKKVTAWITWYILHI